MNCLLKHVFEENADNRIEVTERRRRRCKELMDGLKEMRKYGKLKEEAIDRTLWITRSGRVYRPVVGQSSQ
jgi:predicted AAA+ superfamily ATPase